MADLREDWTREEVEAAVASYFEMLTMQFKGEPFNKTEHRRRLRRILTNRSEGSIEFKHANISAVMIELGLPYVIGYKPRRNYQELIRDVVTERLAASSELEHAAAEAVGRPAEAVPDIDDLLSIEIPPPASSGFPEPGEPRRAYGTPRRGRRDYLAMEGKNRSLGLAGEHLMLKFEHQRLWRAGRRRLADRIDHVSVTVGDHLGYDISSFEESGRERLIEVKTTRYDALTPFFATRNEVSASEGHEDQYHLYRVFLFGRGIRLFRLRGSLRETCHLDPAVYRARPA